MRRCHAIIFSAFLPLLCLANESPDGVMKNVDAYSGAGSISWSSGNPSARSFGILISAFYPKEEQTPYSYRIELSTSANYWQYLKCEHLDRITAVSEDGSSVLNIDLQYSNSFSKGRSKQIFSATVPLKNLEFLTTSRAIMLSACGTTENITKDVTKGARAIIETTL